MRGNPISSSQPFLQREPLVFLIGLRVGCLFREQCRLQRLSPYTEEYILCPGLDESYGRR